MSKASEAKSVFQALDTNGDGELDPQELQCRLSDFGVEVGARASPHVPGCAAFAAPTWPADSHLWSVFCSQDQHIELLFYKLDQNHDNVIDLQEFIDGYDQYMSLVTNGTFLSCTRDLNEKLFLTTDEPIPAEANLVENWCGGKIKLYKSTYPANDPSEDRSTLVIGEDFLFCGVWDGKDVILPLATSSAVSASRLVTSVLYACFRPWRYAVLRICADTHLRKFQKGDWGHALLWCTGRFCVQLHYNRRRISATRGHRSGSSVCWHLRCRCLYRPEIADYRCVEPRR